jgi:hypothetical protein
VTMSSAERLWICRSILNSTRQCQFIWFESLIMLLLSRCFSCYCDLTIAAAFTLHATVLLQPGAFCLDQ